MQEQPAIQTVLVDGQSVQVFTSLQRAAMASTQVCQMLSQFSKITPLGDGAALFVQAQDIARLVNNTLAYKPTEPENNEE